MRIEEFIAARLDEDERAARAAGSAPWTADISRAVHVDSQAISANKQAFPGGWVASVEHGEHSQHIARHDPERALREVAAHRDLLEFYADVRRVWQRDYLKADFVLGKLATIWSAHPDYQEVWSA